MNRAQDANEKLVASHQDPNTEVEEEKITDLVTTDLMITRLPGTSTVTVVKSILPTAEKSLDTVKTGQDLTTKKSPGIERNHATGRNRDTVRSHVTVRNHVTVKNEDPDVMEAVEVEADHKDFATSSTLPANAPSEMIAGIRTKNLSTSKSAGDAPPSSINPTRNIYI
jgi:hypothetical protein